MPYIIIILFAMVMFGLGLGTMPHGSGYFIACAIGMLAATIHCKDVAGASRRVIKSDKETPQS